MARRWSGVTRPGSARPANSSSAAAKASARTTSPDDVELVVLAYVAGRGVGLTDEERNAAVRRALFVFASGGDLHRDPGIDDPAVLELASDLDTPARRASLQEALASVDGSEPLTSDPDLAWRAFACSLLAEAIGEEERD